MKILFITHPYPNYVPDLLLHGLRKLFGNQVIDYPRKNCVYQGILGLGICPDDQRCPGWFPADDATYDRSDIWRKVERGHFNLVICDIRALPLLTDHLKQWPKQCVIIDGEDKPSRLPPGPYVIGRRETDGSDYSIPIPMAIPEELFGWIARYDNLPKRFSVGFLGSTHDGERRKVVETVAARFPDTLFQATAVPNQEEPLPTGRLGRDGYYKALQQCQMVLTLPGAGNDTFRFWENAACNAIHLAPRFPLFIPHDFQDEKEIIRFSNPDELCARIQKIITATYSPSTKHIAQARLKLFKYHLTTHRATYFIDRVQAAFS
jgi:hypothetical protein